MRSLRYAISFGVTFALLASVLVSAALSAQAPTASPTSWSVDKVVRPGPPDAGNRWGSECVSDGCDMQIVHLAHIPESALGDGADVVVQVTLDLKTTPGSYALIVAALVPEQGLLSMRPEGFPVAAPQRTTTTLRWIRHNVMPADGGYDVELEALPRHGDVPSGQTIRATGEKLTVHVSVTP